MDMRIAQPGHQRSAGKIDLSRSGMADVAVDIHYAAVRDEDIVLADQGAGDDIQDIGVFQKQVRHNPSSS
ncbi:hypothetical protein ACUSIJ_27490 [Pseudochelatococcus sp. B33]